MITNDLMREPDGVAILKLLKQHELVDFDHPQFSIVRLVSGTINRNFKVFDGNVTILLKVFSKNNVLPINRQQVFDMQEELAILGLAPEPFFLSEDKQIYCEQWIDTISPEQVNSETLSNITHILAEILYGVHNSYISAPLVALDEHWDTYWQKIKYPSYAFQQKYELVKEQWKVYLEGYRDQFVLCHNDLHVDHLTYPNGPVFDWEYAGLGCRYFDIASCCAINELSQHDIMSLCHRYAHLANIDSSYVIQKVQEVSALVTFTYELWAKSLGISENLE